MNGKSTSPQASQEDSKTTYCEALEKAVSLYKKSSEDNKKSASVWHKEATYYAKELTTYRMLAAIFASLFVVSFVINISK